jgi:T5SS/PEP-CTERM-associated repeat protein
MRVGNSVANLASMAMYAQPIAVTNSSSTATLYVNWGTSGRGRIYQWDQNASLIADHIYATNHYAWSGLDVINLGTLTTRGDSEFMMLNPASPTTFFMANWGGTLATWNILGGTSKMAQDMNLGSPGIYGWGAAGACTAVVSVAGSTARFLAARSVALNTAGAGVGSLTVSSGGYARISGLLRVGWSGGSMGNTVKVTGPNSKLKTDNQVYVYSYLSGNSIQIEKGGTWEHNAANALYFIGAGSSTNNRVVIDGPGSSFTYNDMYIGGGAGVQHGKGWLIVQNGARASSPDGWDHIYVGFGSGNTYGEIRVAGAGSEFLHGGGDFNVGVNGTGAVYVVEGGLLESGITVGANSKGLVMIDGGILQFTAIDPAITVSTPGRLVVTNGTISFRAVTTVNVNGNLSGTRLINATFYGANAFRLNSATNAASGQAYTFNVTGDPRNYARLELLKGSLYRGGAVTIGSSGTLLVTNGLSTVSGDLTFQSGATFAVHAPTNAASAALTVGGAVALGGATLRVTLDAPPVEERAYILIANPGTAPVAGLGTFSAPTVETVCAGKPYTLSVRYAAGDGNDVAVRLASKKGTLLSIR